MSSAAGIALQKGLPANIDAERFILGSILLDDSRFIEIAGVLNNDDFALEKHRRIFTRMNDLHGRDEKIDRVTLANELLKYNELESVDGLSYLCSLDDGLPHVSNLDSYVKIVRDKSTLRRIAIGAQQLMNRALMAEDDPGEVLAGAEETLLKLGEARTTKGLATPLEVIQNYEGGLNAFLDPSKRIKGISTGFAKLDERRATRRRADHPRRASFHGKDRAGVEHVLARGDPPVSAGGYLLA
jgi:replicative DNA helicase